MASATSFRAPSRLPAFTRSSACSRISGSVIRSTICLYCLSSLSTQGSLGANPFTLSRALCNESLSSLQQPPRRRAVQPDAVRITSQQFGYLRHRLLCFARAHIVNNLLDLSWIRIRFIASALSAGAEAAELPGHRRKGLTRSTNPAAVTNRIVVMFTSIRGKRVRHYTRLGLGHLVLLSLDKFTGLGSAGGNPSIAGRG